MGEFADMEIDRAIFEWHDALERGRQPVANTGVCQRCGAQVDFVHTGQRWRLYDIDKPRLHNCATAADPSEFDILDD
jgi:hypothetical protein